ncbi:MAG: branched-chain amino acid aminotransferase [Ginsengibacter sp.]
MIVSDEFIISKAPKSKLGSISLENAPFGKYFTDHMLEVDYEDGEWKTVEIKPYEPISIEPSLAALHYGQSIFEGVKAYKNKDGEARIFRPEDNFKRFNISAERMVMPTVPEHIFIEGMKQLVKLDEKWIPSKPDHSLYIRPFMFNSEEVIGVKPGGKFKFMIILSPTGPYYNAPMRIYVEEKYVRAVPGGVGYAKVAGNYAAAMYATAEAKSKGYDQVLWTDAFDHKYVQECGTMNVFFIIGNKAITPGLDQGTILAGVTRQSTIQLLEDLGLEVEERNISIDEIEEAHRNKQLREAFGTGTAVTISMIQELRHNDYVIEFDVDKWEVAPEVKRRMDAIKDGSAEDKYGWMVSV